MTESVQVCLGHFARVAANLCGFPLDVGVFQIIHHGLAGSQAVDQWTLPSGSPTRSAPARTSSSSSVRSSIDQNHAHVLRLHRAAVRVGQQDVRGCRRVAWPFKRLHKRPHGLIAVGAAQKLHKFARALGAAAWIARLATLEWGSDLSRHADTLLF